MATYWIIKVEFARTPSILAALRKSAQKLKLTLVELDRATGPTVLATRRIRCTGSVDGLIEVWSLVSDILKQSGHQQEPVSVLTHPERSPEPIPPLMTLSEVGLTLGVSRQRAQQLSKKEDFPRPLDRTQSGPIYAASDIFRYHEARERKNNRDRMGEVTLPKVGPARQVVT